MKKIFLVFISIFISLSAQEKNNQNNNSLNLMPISVTIGGKFIVNGSFPASMTERVDQFITRIYNTVKENTVNIQATQSINLSIEQEYAMRGIILKNSNGDERIIDLAKFRINGDFKNNPYLKNDDVLIFPAFDLGRNFVKITGAVNNSVKFMYVEGDKFFDALEFAQGINKSYEGVNKVVIYRLNYKGTKLDSVVFGINENIELKRGDKIYVVADESKKLDYNVNIIGEVKNPGFISISKNKTTVRDAIRMAGGFTSDADLSRAELLRGANAFESLMFSEQIENLQMARMSTLIENDSLYFQIDEKLRFIRGNGPVDFTRISDSSFNDGDFLLKDYDVIYIPIKVNLVFVYGQVNKAGYLNCIPEKNYNYYINLAGGLGETAENIWIIKGQSRSWVSAEEYPETRIEPGDYIWASKKTPRTFWYHIEQAARITAIIGSVATVLLLFK
jgi:protein involved in polysaccharide export with SLBB domain